MERIGAITTALFAWTHGKQNASKSVANRDAMLAIGNITGKLSSDGKWEYKTLRDTSVFLKYLASEHLIK